MARRNYGKKRKYKKKGRKRRGMPTSMVLRSPTVVPDQMFVHLKYSGMINLSVVSGIIARQLFRGNSAYDPDFTGAGGQPLGFDQWDQFYTRYQVISSKCSYTYAVDPTIAPPSVAVLNLVPTDTSTAVSGILQATELPYARTQIVPTVITHGKKIESSMSTRKKFGYRDIEQNEDLTSLTTTNPSEVWYWELTAGVVNGGGSASLDGIVTIDYYVRFFDRRDIARS